MNGKKLLGMVLVLMTVLCVLAPAYAEIVKTPQEDGSLNVRKGPGTQYAVVAWVKNGQRITVIENTKPWAKIMVDANGRIGYIKQSYIVSNDDSSWENPSSGSASYELGRVKTKYASSYVNVRKGPGTGFETAFKVQSGADLSIMGESGNWYLVKTENGKIGYISKNYTAKGIPAQTSANVNLRSGAGTAFASHGVIAKGEKVVMNAVKGNWTNVTVNGATGYIYSTYIK